MAHFGPIAALFLIPLGGWGKGGGGGGCLLLQECRPDSVHDCFAAQWEQWWTNDISNVCFCFLKELVTNLHIETSCVNFLRDKPLLPRTVMEQNAIPWGFSSYRRQQRQSRDRGID